MVGVPRPVRNECSSESNILLNIVALGDKVLNRNECTQCIHVYGMMHQSIVLLTSWCPSQSYIFKPELSFTKRHYDTPNHLGSSQGLKIADQVFMCLCEGGRGVPKGMKGKETASIKEDLLSSDIRSSLCQFTSSNTQSKDINRDV